MAVSVKFIKINKKTIILLAVCAVVFIIAAVAAIIRISAASHKEANFFNTSAEYVSGIDVSQHNGEIEWDKVADSTDFAIIRVAYRGYGNGDISADSRYEANLKYAKKNKVPMGVYFYSQATTVQEAEEEAEYTLDLIKGYDIDLPVFIDYEYPVDENGNRTGRLFSASLSGKETADIINAFCGKITAAGYKAGVYASSSVYSFDIKVSALNKDIFIWVADYNSSVTYVGEYDVWQYSKTGTCDGVSSQYTDLNYWYIK